MNKRELEQEIVNRKENLDISGYAEDFLNWSEFSNDKYCIRDFVGDYINSIQDKLYIDLLEWAKEHIYEVNSAMKKDNYRSIEALLQDAQYDYYYNEIVANIDDIVEVYAYNYILTRLEQIDKIDKSEAEIEELLTLLKDVTEFDSFYDIECICNNFLEG